MFSDREKQSSDIVQRDRFSNELYVIKKSKDFNNYGTLRTKDEYKHSKVLIKTNPAKEPNQDLLLREAFSDRRIRNSGTYNLNPEVNSFQSNLEFRKMGTHQLNNQSVKKNSEALIKNVTNLLSDYNATKSSVSIMPDALN